MNHEQIRSSGLDQGCPAAAEEEFNISRQKSRSHRLRYAARACKECKRRKVKCNGETPCQHCRRYDAQCIYPERSKTGQAGRLLQTESLSQKLEMLQQQVSLLVARQVASEQDAKNQAASTSALRRSPPSGFEFQIPASQPSVDPKTPQREGSKNSTTSPVTAAGSVPGIDAIDGNSMVFSTVSTNPSSSAPGRLAVPCHPLLSISQAEAMRLIDVYEDECGSVYPLIDIGHLRCFASQFYDGVTASRNLATWRSFKLDQSSKRPFNTLEIVLAIALVIECRGSNQLSIALMDELEAEIDHRPSGVSADIPLAEILTLMSLYQFYRDEEVLAWRTIGLAARIALEIGLHLRDPPFAMFQSAQDRERANQLFWCIYCLDRRWSFGTGLPFGIQEDDIDPSLPEPSDSHPYVFTSMIGYSRIGSKIVKASSGSEHLQHFEKREETAFLSYQVQQWYESLDPELHINGDQDLVLDHLSLARNRLRILNYLRKNQLSMLIHRRSLFTPISITVDPRGAKAAVSLAKNTITLLNRLRRKSEIYSSHAVCFNYFLYSALTVILLAVYHAKAQFHEFCYEEFHMALNLIGGISSKSNVARKLWKIIKHLKVTGPETSVLPYMETQHDISMQERNTHIDVSEKFGNTQAVPTSGPFESPHPQPVPVSPGQRELNGFGNHLPDGCSSAFPYDYPVDGTLLSSELSDLFQAIDPTRFEQTPSHSRPSSFQLAQDFSRSARNVF